MRWYIGQEVVCVKTHPDGWVTKGKIYNICSLRMKPCGCGGVQMDVGVKRPDRTGSGTFSTSCLKCRHKTFEGTNNAAWLCESRFAPLMDITELKEILNEEIQRI